MNLDVAILIPCARTWTINANNASEVKSRFIISGANVPYTQGALNILHKKGTICLHGFVYNSGGVYGPFMFDNRISIKDIETFSNSEEYFKKIIRALF